MNSENNLTGRGRVLRVVLALLLLGFGFVGGWILSSRLVVTTPGAEGVRGVVAKGDSPEAIRQGVLTALRSFADGYTKRDPAAIDAFMQQSFLQSENVQLLGTDPGEWNRGYDAVGKFIQNDWVNWGKLRLNIDEAAVSSSGDVAWLATSGNVEFSSSQRPVRFTATLVRINGRWMFHQAQFQWVDRRLALRELFRPTLFRKLRLLSSY